MGRTLAALVVLVVVGVSGAGAATSKPVPVDSCVPKALRTKAISFRASDRVRLTGVLLGKGPNGVVLAHELAANLCNWLPYARTLAASGYRVLALDERNAGVSTSVSFPQSDQLHRDVLGAARELVRRGVQHVVVAGGSAGGTAALTAAPRVPRLAGVVVLSSPATYVDMDALSAAKRVTAPSFFAVATADTRFVPDMQKLYEASAAKDKELEQVDGVAHGTELLVGRDGTTMRAKLLAFIKRAFGSA